MMTADWKSASEQGRIDVVPKALDVALGALDVASLDEAAKLLDEGDGKGA